MIEGLVSVLKKWATPRNAQFYMSALELISTLLTVAVL